MYASAKYLMYDSGFLPTLFTNIEPYLIRKKIICGEEDRADRGDGLEAD
jgi:hypothetical protein